MHKYSASLIVYAATLVAFVVLDVAWLTLFAVGQFQSQLGAILRAQPMLFAAIAFYVVYAAGLVVLAVHPALQERSVRSATAKGAMLGLTAYATFDLTNLAIIERWTLGLALMDMAWGTFVSAVAAMIGCVVGLRISGSTANSSSALDRA